MRPLTARILKWVAAAIAIALVALGAGIAWLLTTEAGLVRAISLLESAGQAQIRVTGARGRLIGPLSAESIEIEHPRATIRITGFTADFEPSELLAGRITAERVDVASASIRVHEYPGSAAPPGFVPDWLMLVIDDATMANVEIVTPGGTVLRLKNVGGSAKMTRPQIAISDARADAGGWAIAGASGQIHAREPLALDINAAWSLLNDRAIIGVAHAGGDLRHLRVDARLAVPGTGHARIELMDLAGELHWRGETRIDELSLSQWIDDAPVGPLSGTFAIEGNRTHYSATGLIHGGGLPATGVNTHLAAHYSDELLTITGLTLSTADAGTIDLDGVMAFRAEPEFDLLARWSDLRWPLTGPAQLRSASGSAQATGWREFRYRLEGKFHPVGALPFSGSASGQITATQMIIADSAWRVLDGEVMAQAMLARDPGRAWTFSGRARRIDPAGLRRDLPGNLSLEFAASGHGLDEHATWAASIDGLSGSFRGQPVSGAGIVRRQPDQWQFERIALALGPSTLKLDGTWGSESRLDARIIARDLSALLPELGGFVDGSLQLHGGVLALGITGNHLAWGDHRAAMFSADAHVDLEDRDTSWLRLRSSGLMVAGQSLTDMRLSLDGLLQDHAVEFRVGTADRAAELLGRGSFDAGQFDWSLQRVAATGPDISSWNLEAPARLNFSIDEAVLERACFARGARRACIEGRWRQDDDWSMRAIAQALPLESLDFELPGDARYRGTLSVDATASGRGSEPWLASIRAEIRDAVLEFASVSGNLQTVALGRTLLAMQSDVDRHRFDLRVVDADGIDLSAEMTAMRVAGMAFKDLPVTGRVRGATRQLALLPLLLRDVDRASGQLAVEVAIAGQVGAPALDGQAQLTEASFDFYQTNLRLRDLQAMVRLHDASIDLQASGTAGEGRLAVDGRLAWHDRRLQGELTLKGERLLLADVPEARVLASPDLRFVLADQRIDVSGSVGIPMARIAPAATAGAVLPSADERIVRPEGSPPTAESFEVTSEIRLQLGDQVTINAYGLRGRITGSMHARSAPGEAAVATGEFQIHDGEYRAYRRVLDVERGRLLFTGGPVTDPGIDLRASRKVPGYTVGVIVRGRLRRPQLTLFSEPPLPQTQIASLLIVGRSLDSLQANDRSSFESENRDLATQGGALLAEQLGRHVGLDEVGLAEDADSGTALVLGKFLSPRLYVSYGISLVDEINTLKLRYTIGDRWVFSAESGREAAADIEFRIER